MLKTIPLTALFVFVLHTGTAQTFCSLNIGNDSTLCFPDTLMLNAGSGFLSYAWSTGATTQTLQITQPDTYFVSVFKLGTEAVTNGSFTSGNAGFISGYTYATYLWPIATYWVGANANTVHPNFIGTAHTPPNFMVANGSSNPALNVWCQTINAIQPNTTYQFSTWVSSVVASSPAILQFRVNGVPLSAPFNAPATVSTWVQYTATWFSGTNTTANICIQNQSVAASGNDFGLDDISFIPVCNVSDTVIISGTQLANVVLSMPDSICPQPTFTGIAQPSGGVWSGQNLIDSTLGIFDYSQPGFYAYHYAIPGKCGDSDTGYIRVSEIPTPFLGEDFELCPGDFATLESGAIADQTLWSTGETSETITINDTGTYWVQQANSPGCTASDTLIVKYRCPMQPVLEVPNVFTPNDDGKNDFFMMNHAYIGTFSIQIVNRWGILVFESNTIDDPWNGQTTKNEPAADGTYFYTITYEGAEIKGVKTVYGTVTLMR
jgi:gliding motility-associated-like protein